MGEERVVVSRRREGRGRSPSPSAPSSAVSFALLGPGVGGLFMAGPSIQNFLAGKG